jgi:WD40 repeat protein
VLRCLAVLCVLPAPDTSPRRGVNLASFEPIHRLEKVTTRSLSPVGDAFAVIEGGNVRIVSVDTGQVRRVLKAHAALVHDLGWSRDGKMLVTTGFEGTVHVWDLAEGRSLLTVTPHPGYT